MRKMMTAISQSKKTKIFKTHVDYQIYLFETYHYNCMYKLVGEVKQRRVLAVLPIGSFLKIFQSSSSCYALSSA